MVDIVVEGVTGFLVPPKDAAALAERLGRLQKDASMRTRMGLAGRAHAEERFDARKSAAVVARVLEAAVAEGMRK